MNFPNTYTLTMVPFYDTYNQCYKNIISINMIPEGPLKYLVTRTQNNRLTCQYEQQNGCNNERNKCILAIRNISNANCCKYNTGCGLMTPDEIPNLFSFLSSNGYTIDTRITNMMNTGPVRLSNSQIICFISYLPPLNVTK